MQRMVGGGAEMMIGAINEPTFGHVIVCGSGGVLIELLADAACRLYPVTDQDAAEMVDTLKGVRLLRGFRGSAPRRRSRRSATPCCASRRSSTFVRKSRNWTSIRLRYLLKAFRRWTCAFASRRTRTSRKPRPPTPASARRER